MKILCSLTLAAAAAAVAATGALAAPVTVNLRVEGLTQTIYEGPVTTDGKVVHMDGDHRCDGTNMGAHPTPGPTMTSALDDGAIANGFTWQGTWYGAQGYEDYGIDRIGPDSNDFNANRYWGYAHNWQATSVGGCQEKVGPGDDVLFAYDFFSKSKLLKLSGPSRAATGERFEVRVHDGQNGLPVDNASVGGATSGPDGRAYVTFDTPGSRRLKAERADSVRSNALDVCVYAPGSGDCGTEAASGGGGSGPGPAAPAPADTTPPRASLSTLRDGARYRRAPRVLSGRVEEDTGIHQIYLRVRMVDAGGCRWLSGRREVFTRPRTCGRARYIRIGNAAEWEYQLPIELPAGARYLVDLKVLDRALNRDVEQVRFSVTP